MARGARCRFSSQAIMCVQLMSWCVAACLLLYRGVTTIRKEPPVLVRPLTNASDLNDTDGDIAHFIDGTKATIIRANAVGVGDEKDSRSPLLYPSASHMSPPAWAQEPRPRERNGGGSTSSTLGKLRHELRPTSLILIVLGLFMLLVGPVVVVLRKCDSTLHHRRASKVATDDLESADPPPTYEEATAGAEASAPRYSTLFEVLESGELVCLNAPAAPASTALASAGGSAAPADEKADASTELLAQVHCRCAKPCSRCRRPGCGGSPRTPTRTTRPR